VAGFPGLQAETTTEEILLTVWVVKEKIASPNCPHFPAKIAGFGLKPAQECQIRTLFLVFYF
jgi:hypothetical protein